VTDLTPELDALVGVARTLSRDSVRQVTDFAEFLGVKYHTAATINISDEDDAVVDLGRFPSYEDRSDLSGYIICLEGITVIAMA